MADEAIRVQDLTKHFLRPLPDARRGLGRLFGRRRQESVAAVDRVSFAVGAGETVAVIGPNGAGKSTTLKMLCGPSAWT